MEFFNKLFNLLTTVNLGAYYPLHLTVFTSAVYFLAVLIAVFYKPLRNLDKTKLLSALIALYLLCAVKVVCDCFFGSPLDGGVLTASIIFALITQIEFSVFCSLKNRRICKKTLDNRLIDEDLKINKELKDLLEDNDFSSSPFKRAEILPTFKEPNALIYSEIETNYSYLLKWIDDLLEIPLEIGEREFLLQVKFEVKKYSLQNPSNFERLRFSSNLDKIIKIASKYDMTKSDVV